jgi:hypothetical protein
MNLSAVRSRLAQLRAQVPQPPARRAVFAFAMRGPATVDEPPAAPLATSLHFGSPCEYYSDEADLEALVARLERAAGDARLILIRWVAPGEVPGS